MSNFYYVIQTEHSSTYLVAILQLFRQGNTNFEINCVTVTDDAVEYAFRTTHI